MELLVIVLVLAPVLIVRACRPGPTPRARAFDIEYPPKASGRHW